MFHRWRLTRPIRPRPDSLMQQVWLGSSRARSPGPRGATRLHRNFLSCLSWPGTACAGSALLPARPHCEAVPGRECVASCVFPSSDRCACGRVLRHRREEQRCGTAYLTATLQGTETSSYPPHARTAWAHARHGSRRSCEPRTPFKLVPSSTDRRSLVGVIEPSACFQTAPDHTDGAFAAYTVGAFRQFAVARGCHNGVPGTSV